MKADERKKQILDAAIKAFAEYGYERTSIAIICEKAGIARPTLYQYFDDKRSVFRELLEGYLLGMHEKIHAKQAIAVGGKKLSRREILDSFHRALFEEISQNRDIFMILIKEARARNAETEDIVKGIINVIVGQFVDEMKMEIKRGAVSDEDLEFAAVYMLGGTIQAMEYYIFDREKEMTTRKFAEKITTIESKIFGIGDAVRKKGK